MQTNFLAGYIPRAGCYGNNRIRGGCEPSRARAPPAASARSSASSRVVWNRKRPAGPAGRIDATMPMLRIAGFTFKGNGPCHAQPASGLAAGPRLRICDAQPGGAGRPLRIMAPGGIAEVAVAKLPREQGSGFAVRVRDGTGWAPVKRRPWGAIRLRAGRFRITLNPPESALRGVPVRHLTTQKKHRPNGLAAKLHSRRRRGLLFGASRIT